MRAFVSLALAFTLSLPAAAQTADPSALVERALTRHILPAYEAFAASAATLHSVAESCNAETIRAAYHDAFDGWMGAGHIAMGPVDEEMRRFSIVFWPDTKGFVAKTVRRLVSTHDPVVDDPAAFAKISVAGHGLTALERLLWSESGPLGFDGDDGAYRCRYVRAIARDLDATAGALLDGWTGDQGYAALLRDAGGADNPIYFTPDDATRDLFKSLDGGLEAIADLRLGRPLGSFEKPRPRRAEAWRSGRSLRNIQVSLIALESLYREVFAPALSATEREDVDAAFARAQVIAARTPEPLDQAVADIRRRIAIESLQTQVRLLQERLRKIVAPAIGASIGFNSLDGD